MRGGEADSALAQRTWLKSKPTGAVRRGSWSSDKRRICRMPSCQWELEPEVFVATVHRVYAVLIRLCPLIRSAHFQVMDDVCSIPPFYYASPFNGAPRLKRCHNSWQLAPHSPWSASSAALSGSSSNEEMWEVRSRQALPKPAHTALIKPVPSYQSLCFAAYGSFWMLLPVLILLCWARQQWCV